MSRVSGAAERIEKAVLSWEGVSAHPHRFGGTEFRLGRRELGHIHGDSLVDIPFPLTIRNELVNSGKAKPHHILPHSGWVSFYLSRESDVDEAVKLLKMSLNAAKAGLRRRAEAESLRESEGPLEDSEKEEG